MNTIKPIEDIIYKLAFREITPVRWNEIYDDESELILDLKTIKLVEQYPSCVKGDIYLSGYQNKLLCGESLSEAQLKQLKCLAAEVAYVKYVMEKYK